MSPSYAADKRVFLYATTDDDNRVLRTTFDDGRLGELEPILTGIPKAVNHDGGRMVFGPDGMLYVSTGEAGQPDLAQDRGSLGGKILRITQDGDPAPGNPDAGSPIWTWGHRNVQGLAFDDAGNLWASEFGQDTFDELNLIREGPQLRLARRSRARATSRGCTDPQVQWSTDDASPSGLAFLDGRLWLGALRGERLWRVDVERRQGQRREGLLRRRRTAGCAPSWPRPTGTCGSPPPTATAAATPPASDDRILLVRP